MAKSILKVAAVALFVLVAVSATVFFYSQTISFEAPDTGVTVKVYEDGSGRLSGTATLSDGQRIVVDGATFCAPGGLCND